MQARTEQAMRYGFEDYKEDVMAARVEYEGAAADVNADMSAAYSSAKDEFREGAKAIYSEMTDADCDELFKGNIDSIHSDESSIVDHGDDQLSNLAASIADSLRNKLSECYVARSSASGKMAQTLGTATKRVKIAHALRYLVQIKAKYDYLTVDKAEIFVSLFMGRKMSRAMIADAIATPGRHGAQRGNTFDEMAIERISASDEWQKYSEALQQELNICQDWRAIWEASRPKKGKGKKKGQLSLFE